MPRLVTGLSALRYFYTLSDVRLLYDLCVCPLTVVRCTTDMRLVAGQRTPTTTRFELAQHIPASRQAHIAAIQLFSLTNTFSTIASFSLSHNSMAFQTAQVMVHATHRRTMSTHSIRTPPSKPPSTIASYTSSHIATHYSVIVHGVRSQKAYSHSQHRMKHSHSYQVVIGNGHAGVRRQCDNTSDRVY